jgi:hypothetical protein
MRSQATASRSRSSSKRRSLVRTSFPSRYASPGTLSRPSPRPPSMIPRRKGSPDCLPGETEVEAVSEILERLAGNRGRVRPAHAGPRLRQGASHRSQQLPDGPQVLREKEDPDEIRAPAGKLPDQPRRIHPFTESVHHDHVVVFPAHRFGEVPQPERRDDFVGDRVRLDQGDAHPGPRLLRQNARQGVGHRFRPLPHRRIRALDVRGQREELRRRPRLSRLPEGFPA